MIRKFYLGSLLLGITLFAFLMANNHNTQEVQAKNNGISYYQKQGNILNGEYKYRFWVKGPMEVIYSGTCQNGTCEGFKESEEEVLKYRTNDKETVIIKQGKEEEYDNLYESLNNIFLNFKELFKRLNSSKVFINKRNKGSEYYYNIDNYEVVVKTNDKEIMKIKIKNEFIDYDFLFDY